MDCCALVNDAAGDLTGLTNPTSWIGQPIKLGGCAKFRSQRRPQCVQREPPVANVLEAGKLMKVKIAVSRQVHHDERTSPPNECLTHCNAYITAISKPAKLPRESHRQATGKPCKLFIATSSGSCWAYFSQSLWTLNEANSSKLILIKTLQNQIHFFKLFLKRPSKEVYLKIQNWLKQMVPHRLACQRSPWYNCERWSR